MTFKVYAEDGSEVTDNRKWFLGSDGYLYYFDESNGSMVEAGDDYWYSFD